MSEYDFLLGIEWIVHTNRKYSTSTEPVIEHVFLKYRVIEMWLKRFCYVRHQPINTNAIPQNGSDIFWKSTFRNRLWSCESIKKWNVAKYLFTDWVKTFLFTRTLRIDITKQIKVLMSNTVVNMSLHDRMQTFLQNAPVFVFESETT